MATPEKPGFIQLFLALLVFVVSFPHTLMAQDAQGKSVLELIDMVRVKGCEFNMGTRGRAPDESPIHKVLLDDYYIGKYEVSQQIWAKVMGNDPEANYFSGCDSCPVEKVSWQNIMTFLKKLNAMTAMQFRLPSEAEWEFAARGGCLSKGYQYSGSNSLSQIAWYESNSASRTHKVGSKRPNELDLYDMSGNVWEWCNDWYARDYYEHSPNENPPGPETGTERVMRGGSWYFDNSGLRVSDRDKGDPELRYGYVGFRLCRSTNGE
ncbi:MAG: SUMF1/EgtB/PvdO family nonheme iron enzyme [Bacteroidota bacterium]